MMMKSPNHSPYSKKNKPKKGNRLPPFVFLLWDLLNSPAYKSLPPSAAKALPYFLGEVKLPHNHPERHQQIFEFSYREGLKVGFSFATFSKIIRDLEKHGFIDLVERGGLRGDCKSYNRFRLSKKWEVYGSENLEHRD